MLEVEHRVPILEGGDQQPLGVVRRGRRHHLEAGHAREPRLDVLRVERPRPHAAPDGHAHDHRHRGRPAVIRLGQVVHDLVEAAGDEVAELHLDHRDVAVEGQAQRRAQGTGLDDRRVADPLAAELGHEPFGHLEHAAVLGDVLPQEHDPRVAAHRLAETVADGVDVAGVAGGSHRLRGGRDRPRARGRVDVAQLALGGGDGIGGRQRLVDQGVDARLHLGPQRVALGGGEDPAGEEELLEAQHGILLRPLVEELLRHVVGARGLLVAPHAEGLELEQRGPLAASRSAGGLAHRVVDGRQVVAVHDLPRHAVAGTAIGELPARVLLRDRRREPVLVVLDHEQHR